MRLFRRTLSHDFGDAMRTKRTIAKGTVVRRRRRGKVTKPPLVHFVIVGPAPGTAMVVVVFGFGSSVRSIFFGTDATHGYVQERMRVSDIPPHGFGARILDGHGTHPALVLQ